MGKRFGSKEEETGNDSPNGAKQACDDREIERSVAIGVSETFPGGRHSLHPPSRLQWIQGGLDMNVIEETIEATLDSNGQLRLTHQP